MLPKVCVPDHVLFVVVEKAVVKTPVEALYERGYVADKDDEEILLLKVVQSAEMRSPLLLADDDGMFRVAVPPRETGEDVQLMSEPVDPVLKVMLEFASWLFPIVEVETKLVPLNESN